MTKKKINYIDILIIIVVIAVLIGGYLYLKKDTGNVSFSTNQVNITYIVEAARVNKDVVQQLSVDDVLVANNMFQDAKITKIEILDAEEVVAIDGNITTFIDSEYKKILVTISGKANKYGPYIDLGGQEIKAGSQYYIKTDIFEAFGYVVKILEIEE